MLIPLVRPSASSQSTPLPPPLVKLGTHLVLLELQGSLEVTGEPEEGDGGVVGEFSMDGDKPMLTIGHHLLEGKVVNLPKPLAILRRKGPSVAATRPSAESEDVEDVDMEEANGQNGTSYEIMEVVRKKVVFLRRPGLVMGSTGLLVKKR